MRAIERAVLAFESEHPGKLDSRTKARAIREAFGFGVTYYAGVLIHALGKPESDELAPDVVAAHRTRVARLRTLPIPAVPPQPATWPQLAEVTTF